MNSRHISPIQICQNLGVGSISISDVDTLDEALNNWLEAKQENVFAWDFQFRILRWDRLSERVRVLDILELYSSWVSEKPSVEIKYEKMYYRGNIKTNRPTKYTKWAIVTTWSVEPDPTARKWIHKKQTPPKYWQKEIRKNKEVQDHQEEAPHHLLQRNR